jgi:hypothetical protein
MMEAGQLSLQKPPNLHRSEGFSHIRGGSVALALVPEDLDELVSTNDAAAACGVDASTIRQWASRGYLAKSGLDDRNRPLYRLIDVYRVARDTRQRALGRSRSA